MIKLNNKIIEFHHFNDGSCRLLCEPISPANIVWLYGGDDEEIIQLYYLISHLKSNKCYVILTMGYVNSARQDRVQKNDDVFTLKYFCNLINSLNIDEVNIFDPHSNTSAALLNNVNVIKPDFILNHLVNDILPHDVRVAYPDSGAEKRYRSMLKLPYVVCVKERNWDDGQIRNMFMLGDNNLIVNHPFLICDDIISRGTTIYLCAKQLKDKGCGDIFVYASHIEATITKPNINGESLLDIPDLITKVYTTNSIWHYNIHPKVEVIHNF